MAHAEHVDLEESVMNCLGPRVERKMERGYQILRTVVWIEGWMGVSVLSGGLVMRTSGMNISGRS